MKRAVVVTVALCVALAIALAYVITDAARSKGIWDVERDSLVAQSERLAQETYSVQRKAVQDSITQSDSLRVITAHLRAARGSAGSAQQIQHQLDSALALGPAGTTASDSAAFWKRNFDASQLVVKNLNVSIMNYQVASEAAERLDAARMATINDLMQQLNRVNAENANLTDKLRTADAPCKIWIFPCVSRTVVAAVGAGGGLLLGLAIGGR